MVRVTAKSEAKRKKFTFTCEGKLKEEYDSLRKQLDELGMKLDLTEDFEKIVKLGIVEMKKSIEHKLIGVDSHTQK
ncbi:hypothetical protein F4826_004781 [Rahnella inusitata]|nr:hypothetical protein [Rahnella inusitata]